MAVSDQAFPPGYAQENHDGLIFGVMIAFSVVSTICLAMRVYSRLAKQGRLELDDYVLIAAYVLAIGESILVAKAATHGLGRHTDTLSDADLVFYGKALLTVATIHNVTLALAKESLLILLYRIFITRKFRITVWVLGVVVAAWAVSCVIAELTICFPISAHWDTTIIGHCGNQAAFIVITAIPWIVTDFAILVAPMPVLKTLRLPRGKKYGVFALFLLGGLTCIVSCVRYKTVFWSREDPIWDSASTAVWNAVETHTSIMIVCLIVSRPALMLLYPRSLIQSARSYLGMSKASEAIDPDGGSGGAVVIGDIETVIYKADSSRQEHTKRGVLELRAL